MSNADFMLTTIDNPFNPFDDFEGWFAFDQSIALVSACSQFARIVRTTDFMSEIETDREEKRAIIEIAEQNVTGTFRIIDESGEFITISEAKRRMAAL